MRDRRGDLRNLGTVDMRHQRAQQQLNSPWRIVDVDPQLHVE
ncbi:hypothetical protein [Mycolicibacterium houstonense]